MESSKSTFTMPLPKLPMDELYARVRESLERMDRQEYEKKRRREAFLEKRWKERCKLRSNGDNKSPLFSTWASAGASSSELSNEELELNEPLKADAVGSSSSPAKDSSAKEDSSPEPPPYKSKYAYLDLLPKAPPPAPIPEEELIRRRKVEQELIALSKKITEEKLRKERMIPFVPAKPTFDPFPSNDTSTAAAAAAADSSDGHSSSRSDSPGEKPESKEPHNPNPHKRGIDHVDEGKKHRNLKAIGVPPQASAYYAGFSRPFGNGVWQHSKEEIDDFVAFVDRMIPTDPKWRKKK
eukprot:scaffold32566_cov161-Skeletonema_marinoi.AAC.1